MNWEAINAVSRFVSSIAVVFSVLHLGIEVPRGHSIACGSIVHNARLLGMALVAAITDGNVAKTRVLLGEWKATGKPWPTGPDEKPR